jgi:hypothetical protein
MNETRILATRLAVSRDLTLRSELPGLHDGGGAMGNYDAAHLAASTRAIPDNRGSSD